MYVLEYNNGAISLCGRNSNSHTIGRTLDAVESAVLRYRLAFIGRNIEEGSFNLIKEGEKAGAICRRYL